MTAAKTVVRHLTTEEFAARIRKHKRTVENMRRDGRGPAYIKDGEIVLYRECDIEAWERSRLITSQ